MCNQTWIFRAVTILSLLLFINFLQGCGKGSNLFGKKGEKCNNDNQTVKNKNTQKQKLAQVGLQKNITNIKSNGNILKPIDKCKKNTQKPIIKEEKMSQEKLSTENTNEKKHVKMPIMETYPFFINKNWRYRDVNYDKEFNYKKVISKMPENRFFYCKNCRKKHNILYCPLEFDIAQASSFLSEAVVGTNTITKPFITTKEDCGKVDACYSSICYGIIDIILDSIPKMCLYMDIDPSCLGRFNKKDLNLSRQKSTIMTYGFEIFVHGKIAVQLWDAIRDLYDVYNYVFKNDVFLQHDCLEKICLHWISEEFGEILNLNDKARSKSIGLVTYGKKFFATTNNFQFKFRCIKHLKYIALMVDFIEKVNNCDKYSSDIKLNKIKIQELLCERNKNSKHVNDTIKQIRTHFEVQQKNALEDCLSKYDKEVDFMKKNMHGNVLSKDIESVSNKIKELKNFKSFSCESSVKELCNKIAYMKEEIYRMSKILTKLNHNLKTIKEDLSLYKKDGNKTFFSSQIKYIENLLNSIKNKEEITVLNADLEKISQKLCEMKNTIDLKYASFIQNVPKLTKFVDEHNCHKTLCDSLDMIKKKVKQAKKSQWTISAIDKYEKGLFAIKKTHLINEIDSIKIVYEPFMSNNYDNIVNHHIYKKNKKAIAKLSEDVGCLSSENITLEQLPLIERLKTILLSIKKAIEDKSIVEKKNKEYHLSKINDEKIIDKKIIDNNVKSKLLKELDKIKSTLKSKTNYDNEDKSTTSCLTKFNKCAKDNIDNNILVTNKDSAECLEKNVTNDNLSSNPKYLWCSSNSPYKNKLDSIKLYKYNSNPSNPKLLDFYISNPKKESTPGFEFVDSSIMSPSYREVDKKKVVSNFDFIKLVVSPSCKKSLSYPSNGISRESTPSFEIINGSVSPRFREETSFICLSCGNEYINNKEVLCKICFGLLVTESYHKILNENCRIKTDKYNICNFEHNNSSHIERVYKKMSNIMLNLNNPKESVDKDVIKNSNNEKIDYTTYVNKANSLGSNVSSLSESCIQPFYMEPSINIFKGYNDKSKFIPIDKDIPLNTLNFNDPSLFNGVDYTYLMYLLRHGYMHIHKVKEISIVPVINMADKVIATKVLDCLLGKGSNISSILKKRTYDLFPQVLPTSKIMDFSYCNYPLLKDRVGLEKYEDKICIEFLNYLTLKFAKKVESVLFITSETDFVEKLKTETLFGKCGRILTSMFAQNKIWKMDSIDKDLKTIFKAARFCVLVENDKTKKQVLNTSIDAIKNFVNKMKRKPYNFEDRNATKLAQYVLRHNNIFFICKKEYNVGNRVYTDIEKAISIPEKFIKCFWGPTVKNMAKNIASTTFFRGISAIRQLLYNQYSMRISNETMELNLKYHKDIYSLQVPVFKKIKKITSQYLRILNKLCDKFKALKLIFPLSTKPKGFIGIIFSQIDPLIASIKKVENNPRIQKIDDLIESQKKLLKTRSAFLDNLNNAYIDSGLTRNVDDLYYQTEYIPEMNGCRCEFNNDIHETKIDNKLHVIFRNYEGKNIKKEINDQNEAIKCNVYKTILSNQNAIEKNLICNRIEELKGIVEVIKKRIKSSEHDVEMFKKLKELLYIVKEYYSYMLQKVNTILDRIQSEDITIVLGNTVNKLVNMKNENQYSTILEEEIKDLIELQFNLKDFIKGIFDKVSLYDNNKKKLIETIEDRYRKSLIYGYLKGYLAAEVLLEYINFDYYDTENDLPPYSKNMKYNCDFDLKEYEKEEKCTKSSILDNYYINTKEFYKNKSKVYVAQIDFNLSQDLCYNLDYDERVSHLHMLFREYNKDFNYDVNFLRKILYNYGHLHGFARFKKTTDTIGNISR